MVAPLKITQSSVALKIPVTSELVEGGLAVNLIDGAIYSSRHDGSIIRIEGDTGNGTIASGASIALGGVMAGVVDVTGTTAITTIVLREGQTRTVRFTGALTLTNSANLVLPSGANIVTAAGDYATFRGYASGVTRCTNYSFANDLSVGPQIHAAISKTTPVDADELALTDSSVSYALKKLTWASLKATLKAYFDTLYGSGSGSVTSVSVATANGVSGAVATATTTPSITLTLGAITPASVAATGVLTGSNLSGTNTGDQTLASLGAAALAGSALQAFSAAALTASGLVNISGSGAGQIIFPATQNPSTNANTLDDYKEGTWTPSVGGTATYNTQLGKYTKIGRLVTLRGRLDINVLGTGSTTSISGMPFPSVGDILGGFAVGYFSNLATSVVHLSGYVTSTFIVFVSATAATTTVTNSPAILGNGSRVDFTLSYEVA